MADEIIFLDTSVLIDYYRKGNKSNSFLYQLSGSFKKLSTSIFTKYEIYVGSQKEKDGFWNSFFSNVEVFPFDEEILQKAIAIYRVLKKENRMIEMPDLLIGATALTKGLPIATLNIKDFSRIPGLSIVAS